MDAVTLALAKKYTKKTLSGMSPIKGEDGPTGPAGPKGPTGDAGPKGGTGDAGPKGPAGSVGQKGPKGDTGDAGPAGIAGPDGSPGPAGPDGAKGAAGSKGPDGAQGTQGPKGPRGYPFLIKKVYDTASAMNAGYATDGVPAGELVAINSTTGGADGGHLYKKGPTKYEFFYDIGQVSGLAGPTGPAGPDGTIGDKGIPGVSGSKGATGDKGSAGPKGAKGETGDTGAKGAKGDTGTSGAKGPKGETGDAGEKGPKGDSGANGPKGEAGDAGTPVTINGQPTKTIQAGNNITIDKSGNILTINATGGGGGGGGMYPVVVISTEPVTAGITFTVGKGASSFTGTTDSTGTVEIEFDDIGTWTISTDYTGEKLEQTIYADSVKIYNVTFKLAVIYGAEWDGTANTKWTRTDSAALFTDPVPYMSRAASYGSPFDDIMPWSGMTVEERTGGTMVKIPKFYYKLESHGDGGLKIQITNEAVPGFSISPAHMDRGDGKGERDVVYIGRYHCASSNYKSHTGELPKASINVETARTETHKLGDTVWQTDFLIWFTIWLLYLVEFADWNSQAVIGCGCGKGSHAENMGYTDSMPYHTGTIWNIRDYFAVGTQYRNIEGLWDNVVDQCGGAYYGDDGKNMYIILNPIDFGDSGGTSIGYPTNGIPTKFNIATIGGITLFIPSESCFDYNTYVCDHWSTGDYSRKYILLGASYLGREAYGLFSINSSPDTGGPASGARLQELP